MFFYLLIVFSTISSLYTLIWDLRMDWGLFDRGAGENTFLREEIVYPHKVEYDRNPTHKHTHTCTHCFPNPASFCPGLLLLCHIRGCDPALCLDDPDLSDHNDQDPLCGRHHSHSVGSSGGLQVGLNYMIMPTLLQNRCTSSWKMLQQNDLRWGDYTSLDNMLSSR